MVRLVVFLGVLSALVILKANAAKILCVFPTPAFSHQIVYRTLTHGLAERGHDVVVITTHPSPGELPKNLIQIVVHDNVTDHIWKEGISKICNAMGDDRKISKTFYELFSKMFEMQIQCKPVRDLIKHERASFDLVILESNVLPTMGFIDVFDAPAIQISTFGPLVGTYAMFGAPNHPLLYPTSINHRMYNMSFWDAITIVYRSAIYLYAVHRQQLEDDEMLQRNLELDIQPTNKLRERVNMYLQTVYRIWDNNVPVPQTLVYLGGLHQKPANNLSQELEALLDSSETGVIYVSFGSNVHPSFLCQKKIDMMAKVFSSLPYEILWKKDKSIHAEISKNVHVSTWYPQSDLLYHPKIKLFITQGGLQSTEEAITAGVPLIGIPMLGDQWMNSNKYVHHGIGLQLDWNKLSEEELTRSIFTVIADKSYKENVIRLRIAMNDQPQSALDRAIWWIEYVVKHGGTRHLFPASANMSWLQYYEVELIIIIVVTLILVLSVLSLIIGRLSRFICRRKTQKRQFYNNSIST